MLTSFPNAVDVAGETNLAAPGVATSIRGSLAVAQGADLDGALDVAGAVSLAASAVATSVRGTLDVLEATSLAAAGVATSVRGTLSVAENATFSANATVQGTLSVTGVGTFDTLRVNRLEQSSTESVSDVARGTVSSATEVLRIQVNDPTIDAWHLVEVIICGFQGTGGTATLQERRQTFYVRVNPAAPSNEITVVPTGSVVTTGTTVGAPVANQAADRVSVTVNPGAGGAVQLSIFARIIVVGGGAPTMVLFPA